MGTPLDPTIRSHFGDYLDRLSAEAIYNLPIRELLLNAYEAGWKEGVDENYTESPEVCVCGHAITDHAIRGMYHDECQECSCKLYRKYQRGDA